LFGIVSFGVLEIKIGVFKSPRFSRSTRDLGHLSVRSSLSSSSMSCRSFSGESLLSSWSKRVDPVGPSSMTLSPWDPPTIEKRPVTELSGPGLRSDPDLRPDLTCVFSRTGGVSETLDLDLCAGLDSRPVV
jgi:hypothetical protein